MKLRSLYLSRVVQCQHESITEVVVEATAMIKKQCLDLSVGTPLQYDTAVIESVVQHKALHSDVAGRAIVLIFPDFNTRNMIYIAVCVVLILYR